MSDAQESPTSPPASLPASLPAELRAELAEVREWLLDAGYTTDGVLERIGGEAFAAIARHEWVPVRLALADAAAAVEPGDSVGRLIRLFMLHEPVSPAGLGSFPLAAAEALGLVAAEAGEVRALLEVRPYGEPDTDWYSVADIGGPRSQDHVLGIGGASLTLARVTPRPESRRTLDLGVGCGIQALHASRHSEHLTITDTNPRALRLAQLTLGLSGVDLSTVEPRLGSLFEPVAAETFDLIVSNPPFVISPSPTFTYRDGGMAGDDLSRAVIRDAAGHLNPGGWACFLANWLHLPGQTWQERVEGWLDGVPADAWVIQRDYQTPAEYVELWLRDADQHERADYERAYETWLAGLGEAEAIGFGWVVLHRPVQPRPEPWRLIEEAAPSTRLPRGDEVMAWMEHAADTDPSAVEVLAMPVRLAAGVTLTGQIWINDDSEGRSPVRVGRAGEIGQGGWRGETLIDSRLAELLRESTWLEPAMPFGELLGEHPEADDLMANALIAIRGMLQEGLVVPRAME